MIMSTESFHEPGDPLSLGEHAAFSEIILGYLAESGDDRPWYPLSASSPGDRFLLRTVDGEMQFDIIRLNDQRQSSSGSSIDVRRYGDSELMRHEDFLLIGASEGGTMLPDINMGVIEQYADLSYAPMHSEPLWSQDLDIGDEEYDKKLRSGEIVRTQSGRHVRMNVGSAAVLAVVLDLARIDEQGNPEYIFKHED